MAVEACASSHYWAREIGALGHEIRMIPPAYVKPFVKRQKNDMADAEAICEAAQRPTMRFVAPKSAEAQGAAVLRSWRCKTRSGLRQSGRQESQTRGMAQRSEDGVGKTREMSKRLERAIAGWTRSAISIQASGHVNGRIKQA